jgi:hypothetical protein
VTVHFELTAHHSFQISIFHGVQMKTLVNNKHDKCTSKINLKVKLLTSVRHRFLFINSFKQPFVGIFLKKSENHQGTKKIFSLCIHCSHR